MPPGDTLRAQLLKLVGLAEYELESVFEPSRLDGDVEQDKNDIRTAAEWLNANMDFVIADAEFDGRI